MAGQVSVTREIGAPAELVWAMVSDVTRMGEWSPENEGCTLLGGATAAQPGARFRGVNRNGKKKWTTMGTVVNAEPGRRFSFRVDAGGSRSLSGATRSSRPRTDAWSPRLGLNSAAAWPRRWASQSAAWRTGQRTTRLGSSRPSEDASRRSLSPVPQRADRTRGSDARRLRPRTCRAADLPGHVTRAPVSSRQRDSRSTSAPCRKLSPPRAGVRSRAWSGSGTRRHRGPPG